MWQLRYQLTCCLIFRFMLLRKTFCSAVLLVHQTGQPTTHSILSIIPVNFHSDPIEMALQRLVKPCLKTSNNFKIFKWLWLQHRKEVIMRCSKQESHGISLFPSTTILPPPAWWWRFGAQCFLSFILEGQVLYNSIKRLPTKIFCYTCIRCNII